MVSRFLQIVLFIVPLTILQGCGTGGSSSIVEVLNRFPAKFEYQVFEQGKLKVEKQLTDSDQAYTAVYEWLRAHEDGWRQDTKTYASNRLFLSEDIRINVLSDGVVINYSADGQWKQLSLTSDTASLSTVLK